MEITVRLHNFRALKDESSANRRLQPTSNDTIMILTAKRKEEINHWVERARSMAGTDEIIDLEALAQKAGIKVKHGNYHNDFAGMLVLKGDQFTIYLHRQPGEKPNHNFVRYTLAHELGHFFIFSHKARLLRGEVTRKEGYILAGDELTEKEAEYFASCLLMPESQVVPVFESAPLSHRLLWEMADCFKVSLAAITGRYSNLGPTPILMVWSTNGQYEKTNKSKGFPFFNLNLAPDNQMPECCFAANLHELNGNETLLQTHAACSVLKSSRPIPEDMRLVEFSYFLHKPTGKMLSVFWEEEGE